MIANTMKAGLHTIQSFEQALESLASGNTNSEPAKAFRKFWEERYSTDPGIQAKGLPPFGGQDALPHVVSFQGVVSSISRVYRAHDEAIKFSLETARAMRNDPIVMECVEQRQRSLALLDWHIEADDENDPVQEALAGELTAILEATPRFMQYRENLGSAVFFGRYGVQHRYRWKYIRNQWRCCIQRWMPVHGDKIVFRYDDGTGEYDGDQVGIRVGAGLAAGSKIAGRWTSEKINSIEPTDFGLAYFLQAKHRPLLAIHKHYIEDGEYEDPQSAGKVHGVGIRSRIFWAWYQKQETLAWMMEYIERSAFGIEIWYYPWGNAEAEAKTRTAAQERIGQGRNIVLVPKPMGEEGQAYGVERIEPGMAGVDACQNLVTEYFGHMLKRYILGQTLTTEAASTGLGSNLGEIHLDTYLQIIKYDATNLEETITSDTLQPLLRFNFPKYANIPLRFRIDTHEEDIESKLKAWRDAFDMGMELREQDVGDLIGATKPSPGDAILSIARLQAAQQPPQMPGMGAPPGMDPNAPPADPNAIPPGVGGTSMMPQAAGAGPVPQEPYSVIDADKAKVIDSLAAKGIATPSDLPGVKAGTMAASIANTLAAVSPSIEGDSPPSEESERRPVRAMPYSKELEGTVQRYLAFDPDEPRDEGGKWTKGTNTAAKIAAKRYKNPVFAIKQRLSDLEHKHASPKTAAKHKAELQELIRNGKDILGALTKAGYEDTGEDDRTHNVPPNYRRKPYAADGAEADDAGKAAYIDHAQKNLMVTSRTAQGNVDTSASKEKAGKLAVGSGQEAAHKAGSNFQHVMGRLHDERHKQFSTPAELLEHVDTVNKHINHGIVKPGVFLRTDDSPKYNYHPAAQLEQGRHAFAQEFHRRLDSGDPVETAAWVHHALNHTLHPYADGVGKTAEATANWVLMRHNKPLPTYRTREEIFQNVGNFDKWHNYYRSLFPSAKPAQQERYSRSEIARLGLLPEEVAMLLGGAL